MSISNYILFKKENSIAKLILNRPEIRNAFNDKLINEFDKILDKIETDNSIKAVILQGSGEHFSAGADLNWMKSMIKFSEEENFNDALKLANMLNKLNNLNKLTIAKIKGSVFGGAIGLVACCDIAIADDNAKFCLSEVKLGISPAVISPYVISAIGSRNARRYMLTAELFDAEKAKEIGLIHEITPKNELDNKLNELISIIKNNGPIATKETKKLIFNVAKNAYNKSLNEDTAKLIARLRISKEGQEGLSAFLEKRTPSWLNG